MKIRLVLKLTGKSLLVGSLCMAAPLLTAFYYHENPYPLALGLAIMAAAGLLLSRIPAEAGGLFAREGFASVALIWLLMGVFGALPFLFSGYFASYIDCLFEALSGFTTTGASVLVNVENLPRSILFWRSFMHWMGGMGVLVLTMALLPSLGARSNYLMQAETPGPTAAKLVPKVAQNSKILYGIYCAFTLLLILLLLLAGLPLFDAVVTSFSTVSTGGLSDLNASVAGYANSAAEIIIAVFMLLCGVNFSMFFLLLRGHVRSVLRSTELRVYVSAALLATLLLTVSVRPMYESLGRALRLSFFQVASIFSSTGFVTADYSMWPVFCQIILLLLMICGGCSGSTSGGFKAVRVVLLFKQLRRNIRQCIHPSSCQIIRLDGHAVDEGVLRGVSAFLAAYLFVGLSAALLVSLDGGSFTTVVTAVAACLSNTGPGLDAVGPAGNYAGFSALSKLALSLCMVIGRLEFFPVLILFSRNAWRHS